MQRLPFIALIAALLTLWPVEVEAGPFDGEWKGVATATSGRCKPAVVTLSVGGTSVGGTSVEGEAQFDRDKRSIYGTVTADGAFGATIGFDHLTGTFMGNLFEGTFTRTDCSYKVMLKRTG
jgi:hypothetical protein